MPEEAKISDLEQGRGVRNWDISRDVSNERVRTHGGDASTFGLDMSGRESRESPKFADTRNACTLGGAASTFGLPLSRTERQKDGQEKKEGEEEVAAVDNATETNSAKLRRHLADSIYLWSCGEAEENADYTIKLPDILIGWLVLMLQGLAYIMLIARAKNDSDTLTSTENSSDYSMASVTGAMYLLVASTTPDLRAGFTLVVDGLRIYHRVFGAALLTLYGLMICAAMKVLFTTSNDDASVVINAVTVLFIADVDEKALSFFRTVPYKWRLFWAIYTVGISFALALVGIVYVGDPRDTVEGSTDNVDVVLDLVPSWFICAVNPGAVTLLSFYLSTAVLAFSEALSAAVLKAQTDDTIGPWGIVVVMCVAGVHTRLERTKELMRIDTCFCVTLGLWLAHGVVSWGMLLEGSWGSTVTGCNGPANNSTSNSTSVEESGTDSSSSDDVADTDRTVLYVALIISNVALFSGLSIKAVGACIDNQRRPATSPLPQRSTQKVELPSQRTSGWLGDSQIPSLLVGWGIGYWATSLLLGGSLYELWWSGAPLATTIIGYLVLPCFFVAVIFIMVDSDFLGKEYEPYLDPTSRALKDKRGVCYWILATAIRDVLLIWVFMWHFLVPCLNNI